MFDIELIAVFNDGYRCNVNKLTEDLVQQHGKYNLMPTLIKVTQ
jgi:hypothetical protein